MKRKWWLLVPVALALIGVVWMLASDHARLEPLRAAMGLQPPSVARTTSKPICSQAIVPAGADCIPQHMAHLPPDPGEAGKATIDGIDADQDGVRDDVQRYIWENWPDSERARRALFAVAKSRLLQVHHGEDLGKEGTRKLVPQLMKANACFFALQTPELAKAFDQVRIKVTNTPERWKRAADFNYQLAHSVYPLSEETAAEACGFDPASLPN